MTGTRASLPKTPSREQPSKRAAGAAHTVAPGPTPTGRAPCACGGACPRCQSSRSETATAVQPGSLVSRAATDVVARPRLIANDRPDRALGGGEALAPQVRTEMEERLGADFGGVRVHNDDRAHASAAHLQANAYTVGSDIAFASGRYAPSSSKGKRLLAHELVHVVQQRRGGAPPALDAGAANEQAADRAADGVLRGGAPIAVEGATAPGDVAVAPVVTPTVTPAQGQGTAADSGSGLQAAMVERIKRALVDSLMKTLGLPPTSTRLAMAVGRGLGEQLVQELIHDGKGLTLLGHIASMDPSDMLQVAKGYYVGLVEGIVSPVTDLFGLAVFGERIRNLSYELLASAFNSRGQIGKEAQELLDEVGNVGKSVGVMWQHIKDDPQTALVTLLSLPDALSDYAEQKAYELGKAGGSQIVASFEAPWSPEKKPESSPSLITSPFAWVESKAKAAEDWVLDTPWSQIGSKFGYAIGFVVIQVVLIAFTDGIGNAIEQVGAGLGKIAGVLGKLGKALGSAASRVAELVGMLGKGIAAVEEGIAFLAGKALKPLEKLLEPVLEPLGRMFTKLRKFLRKLFGVAEKEGTQLVDAAAGKTATALDDAGKTVAAPIKNEPTPKIPTPPETKVPAATKTVDSADPIATTTTGGTEAAAKTISSDLEVLEARLYDLEDLPLPPGQRKAMAEATARVRELARTDPEAAEQLLESLEARFFPHGPPGTTSQVTEDLSAVQEKLYPDKGPGGKSTQSVAGDERALLDQDRPSAATAQKAKVMEAAKLGEAGGRDLASGEGITVWEDWNTPDKWKGEFGRGIDDIGERNGKLVVLEYKYGGSSLGESGDIVQMSNEWVGRKIAELEHVGDIETAQKLLQAAQDGRLQGVVYWTRELKAGETTSRLQAFQLRGKLPTENIGDSGLIQYARTKIERAYLQRLQELQGT